MNDLVRIYREREPQRLGAVRYEVAWEEVRESAKGQDEIDPDCDIVYRYATYKQKSAAMRAAKKVLASKVTAFGEVTVIKQVVDWLSEEDRVAEWVNTDEKEYLP